MSKGLILREDYINKIKPYINVNLIKVFVGQRRVGKSFLLKMIMNYILGQFPKGNYIYIDKEQYEFPLL